MNQILKTIIPVLTCAASLSAASLSIKDLSTMNFFKNKGVSILDTSAVNNNITLVSILAQTPNGTQKVSAFVTNDKKYVIVGGGFIDKTGEQILIPSNMAQYKQVAGMVVGDGKEDLYVFTDPQCPYCMKMEQAVLAKLNGSRYTAHVFFFPLSFHQYAESAAYFVMSKKSNEEKLEALDQLSKGFTPSSIQTISKYDVSEFRTQQAKKKREIELFGSKKDMKADDFAQIDQLKKDIDKLETKVIEKVGKSLYDKLAKQMEIAQALGVSGTPSVFDKTGVSINWTTLSLKEVDAPSTK